MVKESHRALPHIKMRVSQKCIHTHNLANSSESNTEAHKQRPLQMDRCSIHSPTQLYHAGDDDRLHEALHRWTLVLLRPCAAPQCKRYTKSGYGESSPMTRTDAQKVSRYSPVVSLAAPLRSKRPRPSRLATSHRGASAAGAAVHFTFNPFTPERSLATV